MARLDNYGAERAIIQGHDYYGWNGPGKAKDNPHQYRFNGAWSMGYREAQKGRSIDQTVREFKRLGYDTD